MLYLVESKINGNYVMNNKHKELDNSIVWAREMIEVVTGFWKKKRKESAIKFDIFLNEKI
jgi:hypothetical protein